MNTPSKRQSNTNLKIFDKIQMTNLWLYHFLWPINPKSFSKKTPRWVKGATLVCLTMVLQVCVSQNAHKGNVLWGNGGQCSGRNARCHDATSPVEKTGRLRALARCCCCWCHTVTWTAAMQSTVRLAAARVRKLHVQRIQRSAVSGTQPGHLH